MMNFVLKMMDLQVETSQPTHYYALFGLTAGYDTVLAQYSDGRCEVESKYTTFVELRSRSVPPRIDMTSLVPLLNTLEVQHGSPGAGAGVWMSEGLGDAGPVLRLQALRRELTHAQRYGHPCERPILTSHIPGDLMRATIVQHFEVARGVMESSADGGAWLRPSVEWSRGAIAEFNRAVGRSAAASPRL